MTYSESQFQEIIEAHKRIIYKICHSYTRNESDFNDLTQEIIIQIWQSLSRYNGSCKLSTWIYRISLNTAISAFRYAKVRENIATESILDHTNITVDFEQIENPETEKLYDLINMLNPFDKAIIILVLDGYNHQTISEIMGLTISNVSTKISRIKQLMKKNLNKIKDIL